MYTAYIGRRLVALINARQQTQYSVQEFFDEVYFPLFFDSDRYLQHVNNSKFDQAYKQKGKTPLTATVRAAALAAQRQRIRQADPDGSFFLGGAAAELTAGTSGQVTDIKLPITSEEVYASWIGAAIGIGVSGGLNILVDADEVLLALYDGWKEYRKYLNSTPNLKPHQINTWNGWWITTAFARKFNPLYPFAERQPDVKTDKMSGGASLETQKWIKVIFSMARKMPKCRLTTYVYALSQRNTTLGFVIVELPEIVTVERDAYRQLFAEQGNFKEEALDDLYNTELGFQKACELGMIGLPAIEPASLREYMPSSRGPGKSFKVPKDKEDLLHISYSLYQTWIIAMLNNQQLLDMTQRIAATLSQLADTSPRGKKVNRNSVIDLLEASSRRQLIEQMATLVTTAPEQALLFDEIGNTIIKMPSVDFPLFMALLKLKYAVAQAKQ